MTLKEFTDLIQEIGGYESKAEAKKAISTVFDAITQTLEKKGSIMIPGFGSWSVTEVAEKSGKIPGTNKSYTKPAHTAPKFRFAKGVKDTVAKS